MPLEANTIASVLTPHGRGAIATIRIVGPAALGIVSKLLLTGLRPALAERPCRSIVFGRWGDESGEELVASCLSAEQVEVHCHGGVAAVARIVADLEQQGCQIEPWQNCWVHLGDSTVVNAWRQMALVALAGARTERTAGILLDQYGGALTRAVQKTLALLTASQIPAALDQLDEILSHDPLGVHLVQPWSVVLAGRPNVGKSSLINALLGYRRAIVFDTPGTTRDIVKASTAFDGWPVEISDTAGWRDNAGELESLGIAAAKVAAAQADLVLLVADRSQAWTAAEEALAAALPQALLIWNKSDLPMQAQVENRPGVAVSALSGEGLPELITHIAQRLVPRAPSPGAAVPFTAGQIAVLSASKAALQAGDVFSAQTQLRRLLD